MDLERSSHLPHPGSIIQPALNVKDLTDPRRIKAKESLHGPELDLGCYDMAVDRFRRKLGQGDRIDHDAA